MKSLDFAKTLIEWYGNHKRNLPWRSTRDPYKIWLSEIILQQTRVDQGLPYYLKFVQNYPSVRDLASAEGEQILKLWEGLGYYSRAKNLHRCAKNIVNLHGSIFPKSYSELLTLPGIGPYSAAAIASFAYKEPVAVLDGNVYRVISRIFGIKDDISQSKSAKVFTELANKLVDPGRPDEFNQAIMEFGALHCKPQAPLCNNCNLSTMCYAFDKGEQKSLPVKTKKVKVSTKYFSYIVFEKESKLAMKKRGDDGIWKGLYDFDLISTEQRLTTEELLVNLKLKNQKAVVKDVSKEYKHILTHQHIYATFYKVELPYNAISNRAGLSFYGLEEIEKLPKPVLISKYLNENIF